MTMAEKGGKDPDDIEQVPDELTPEEWAPEAAADPSGERPEAVFDVPVKVSTVLGKASLHVNQMLRLGKGAVVELDRKVGEPVEIYVNNQLVARGELVVIDDRLGVTMTEIIKTNSKEE